MTCVGMDVGRRCLYLHWSDWLGLWLPLLWHSATSHASSPDSCSVSASADAASPSTYLVAYVMFNRPTLAAWRSYEWTVQCSDKVIQNHISQPASFCRVSNDFWFRLWAALRLFFGGFFREAKCFVTFFIKLTRFQKGTRLVVMGFLMITWLQICSRVYWRKNCEPA